MSFDKKEHNRQWRISHRKYFADYQRQWREDNPEKAKEIATNSRKKNPSATDPLKRRAYQIKNADKIRDYMRNYARTRRKRDIPYKLAIYLRARLRKIITQGVKAGSSVNDLGCSPEELKKHLESQFVDGMNWKNYGRNGWHMDHIVPLTKFNLTDREQFLIANHYTNLRPVWESQNISKSNMHVLDFREGIF